MKNPFKIIQEDWYNSDSLLTKAAIVFSCLGILLVVYGFVALLCTSPSTVLCITGVVMFFAGFIYGTTLIIRVLGD